MPQALSRFDFSMQHTRLSDTCSSKKKLQVPGIVLIQSHRSYPPCLLFVYFFRSYPSSLAFATTWLLTSSLTPFLPASAFETVTVLTFNASGMSFNFTFPIFFTCLNFYFLLPCFPGSPCLPRFEFLSDACLLRFVLCFLNPAAKLFTNTFPVI